MVLDSSVIVKWLRQEEILAREALALRQAYLDGKPRLSGEAASKPRAVIYNREPSVSPARPHRPR